MAGIWHVALNHGRLAAVVAGCLWLSACGGGSPSPEPDWAADAARAGVSALTTPPAAGSGNHSLTLAWTDTIDGELGWRVEAQGHSSSGNAWQSLGDVAASPGRGQTLSLHREIAGDTVLRVLALLPDGQTVVLGTAAQGTQLTARTRLPGVAIEIAGTDQPLSGDTRIGLTGAAGLLSAQYSARPVAPGVVGDGLLGTPLSRTGPSFTVPWRSGLLPDGAHRIDAKLEVEAGNFIVLRRDVDVHNSGLRVGVVAAVIGQQVTLRVDLRSNRARPSFTVFVDGQQVAAQTLASGWQVQGLSVPLGELAPGWHYILVVASDSSGAIAQAADFALATVDVQARLDVTDGTIAFGTLAIRGSAGVVGGDRPVTARLSLDQDLVFSSQGGDFDITLDLASLAAGPHTLRLEVQDANGNRTSITRNIVVRKLLPRWQRIKAIEAGPREPSTLTGVVSNGRFALYSGYGCASAGGRTCINVTTVDPDTPQVQAAYARSAGVTMNPDWTYVSEFDGAVSNSRLLPAPGNTIPIHYGSCKVADAGPQCRRRPEGLAIKEWAQVSDFEPTAIFGRGAVLRNMRTGEERPLPGPVVSTIPVAPTTGGGWQWMVKTAAGYAIYDSLTGTSTPVPLPGSATGLASDGRRLVWLLAPDSAAPRRRQLLAALPGATQSPQLLADYTLTDSAAAAGEATRAGGGWVVWAERNSVTGVDMLKAHDGGATREIARAAAIEILNFDPDTGAVLWWDGTGSHLWVPGSGQQTVALERISAFMTRRGLYMLLEDRALWGLAY